MTNETYRWVSDPRFHPSGEKIIATKWYTSSRSLGAGEGWEYSLPSKHERITTGSGRRVVGRTLPLGWSTGMYGQQQIGPEQFIWYGNDSLIFSKNTADTNGAFMYSKGMRRNISILWHCFQYFTCRHTFRHLLDIHVQHDDHPTIGFGRRLPWQRKQARAFARREDARIRSSSSRQGGSSTKVSASMASICLGTSDMDMAKHEGTCTLARSIMCGMGSPTMPRPSQRRWAHIRPSLSRHPMMQS